MSVPIRIPPKQDFIKYTGPMQFSSEVAGSQTFLGSNAPVYTENTSLDDLCTDIPKEFSIYMKYCRLLRFREIPNYKYLKNIFLNIFANEGCKMVNINCKNHDKYLLRNQFITHFIGRMLKELKLKIL